jgi:hypothetical protein
VRRGGLRGGELRLGEEKRLINLKRGEVRWMR